MLKSLFSSTARIKILRIFLLSEEGSEYFVRQLTRELDEQINSIRRELENLEKIGMLTSKTRDRKKYYKVNLLFPILSELRTIFKKADSDTIKILKKIRRMGRLDFLVLLGQFTESGDNVDLVAVGDLDKKKLSDYLSRELGKDIGFEIRYSVLTREDFVYRVQCRDKFAMQMTEPGEGHIILENKLDKYL